ncbi:MAG: inositol monophosphatase family protein [Pseudomonadota bacterium]
MIEYRHELIAMIGAALRAGAAIRAISDAGVVADTKSDGSPVCAADKAGETIILDALQPVWPDASFVGEEMVDAGNQIRLKRRMVLVDALDGTKEFIAGRDDYTVNIAIVEDGLPVAGVVHQPANGLTYAGEAGLGAFSLDATGLDPEDMATLVSRAKPLRPAKRAMDRNRWRAVMSRSHADPETTAFMDGNGIGQTVAAGSSVKFCVVARGDADLYPRLGPIRAWDIAAGHAVLVAAGGHMTHPDGTPYRYNFGMNGFSCSGFIAWGSTPESVSLPDPDAAMASASS